MASSYTTNNGIEQPASGDQSGTWGTTTNTNFDIIDRALNGVGTITLTGTTKTLTTTDGTLSEGHYKVIIFDGTPGGAVTVTISPNDQSKTILVNNASDQNITFTQGTGGNVTVNTGASAWIYADGAGAGAQVRQLPADLVGDSTPQLGGNLDTNGNAILFAGSNGDTSKWAIEYDSGDNDLLFKYNGTTVLKVASSGAITSADDITAFGTP